MEKSILDWEEFLIPFFDDIKFVGEIPLSLPQIYQIGEELKKNLKGKTKQTQLLCVLTEFPRSFVTFLALMSAYNTEVDYWGIIKDIVKVRDKAVFFNNDFHWGKTFLYLLKKYKLETFEDEQFSNRYVTTIRLHGGIPAHSLPDFFEHIIDPYLNEPKYLSLKVEEFVPLILETPNAQYYVDKPVKYFLENLPSFAKNYVNECKRMAYDYTKDPDTFSLSSYDLPKYVSRTFQKFKENERIDEDRQRLKRPSLFLIPYQGGDINITLPSQEVSELEAQEYFFIWKIYKLASNNKELITEIPVRVRRIGYELITHEVKTDILLVIQNYEIEFSKIRKNDQANIEILRRWRFNLDQIDSPLIAFYGDTGKYIQNIDTLPSSTLWFVYPDTHNLLVKGGTPGVKYPPFSDMLSNYILEEWDLSEADQVILTSKESGKKIPYLIERTKIEPKLLGDNIFTKNQDPDSTPIYISNPPKLIIPRNQFKSNSKDLSQWYLSITNKWVASPEIENKFNLFDYADKIEVLDEEYVFDLTELLNRQVFGTYQLMIHGEIGTDTLLNFRVIPTLELIGLEDFYLPNHPSYENVNFQLRVPQDTSIELLDRSTKIFVDINQVDDSLFSVSVKPDVEVVEIVLIREFSEEYRKDIRIPIFIPVVRPSFKVILNQVSQTDEWSTDPVIISMDDLLQSAGAFALIRFQTQNNISLMYRIDLVDILKDSLIQSGKDLFDLEKSQIISRYNLDQFSSSINKLKTSSSLSFVVKIYKDEYNEIDSYPILYLRRYLDLESFSLETLDPGIRITWQSKNRLENRRLRIWSLWKPWQPPIEIDIPDACDNFFETREVGLPHSCYKVQFFTAAPWKEKPPSFYPPEKGFIKRTKSVKERLAELNHIDDEPLAKRVLHAFEKACIYQSISDIEKRDQEIQVCWHLITCNKGQINIAHLINFYQWLTNIDSYTRKALIIYLLKPEVFNNVLKLIGENSWAWKELVNIFIEADIDKISTDVALIVLGNEASPLIRLKAFEILMKKDYPNALQIILDEVLSGQLSERAAISLIKKHPSLKFKDLYEKSQQSPELLSIIDQWAISEGWLVKVGYWVHSAAGWGRINKIKYSKDQKGIGSFYHNVETPQLHVKIRPEISNLDVIIDLSANKITFKSEKLYQCRKYGCVGFVSSTHDDVKHHNDICHDGLSPMFRILSQSSIGLKELTFKDDSPVNIWS